MQKNELKKIRTIIQTFLNNVNNNWDSLDDQETHDRYHQLYDMVEEASEDSDFKKYVQPIPYWSTFGGSSKLWKSHATTILNSGTQLLAYIDAILKSDDQSNEEGEEIKMPDSKKVFVVHGRNHKIRNSIFQFLRSIGVNPIEWIEAKKLTGNASPFIAEVLDAAFSEAQAIIVLFTPDDIVKLKDEFINEDDPDYEKDYSSQARPNVIFEAGMAMGRSENRTIFVEFGEIKPFSDVSGRHVVRFKEEANSKIELIELLKLTGVEVDIESKTDWLTVGDFSIE